MFVCVKLSLICCSLNCVVNFFNLWSFDVFMVKFNLCEVVIFDLFLNFVIGLRMNGGVMWMLGLWGLILL